MPDAVWYQSLGYLIQSDEGGCQYRLTLDGDVVLTECAIVKQGAQFKTDYVLCKFSVCDGLCSFS